MFVQASNLIKKVITRSENYENYENTFGLYFGRDGVIKERKKPSHDINISEVPGG